MSAWYKGGKLPLEKRTKKTRWEVPQDIEKRDLPFSRPFSSSSPFSWSVRNHRVANATRQVIHRDIFQTRSVAIPTTRADTVAPCDVQTKKIQDPWSSLLVAFRKWTRNEWLRISQDRYDVQIFYVQISVDDKEFVFGWLLKDQSRKRMALLRLSGHCCWFNLARKVCDLEIECIFHQADWKRRKETKLLSKRSKQKTITSSFNLLRWSTLFTFD